MERLELSQQKLLGPKSSASTNFATSVEFFFDEILTYEWNLKNDNLNYGKKNYNLNYHLDFRIYLSSASRL